MKFSRFFNIVIRDEKDMIDGLDDLIARVVNSTNKKSRDITYQESLLGGLMQKDKENLEAGQYNTTDSALARQFAKEQQLGKDMRGLAALRNQMGEQRFLEWCETTEEVSQEIIQYYLATHTWRNVETPQSARIRDWLGEYLVDEQPHTTGEVRAAAISAGVIDDTDDGWQRMRQVASRMNLTNNAPHGSWRLVGSRIQLILPE